jgi:hypothetical protein
MKPRLVIDSIAQATCCPDLAMILAVNLTEALPLICYWPVVVRGAKHGD